MVTKDFTSEQGVDTSSWQAALTGRQEWQTPSNSKVKPLIPGESSGVLYGGCLSILVASLGTPYEIKTPGTILFLEDIATKPFQIDRMLMQLKLAGKLSEVKGIVFGEMLDCVQHAQQGYTLEQVIVRVVGDLGIPVAFGLPSGHVSTQNITLPMGIHAKLSVGKEVQLTMLEPATAAARAGVPLATGKRA
jgi:muramoyltetrapeptide carboxypeptidase